jgi:TonB-linked SusC/RagA family outer membrane protein
MKRILLVCLTAVLALASSELWAQERTVSGRVTSTEDESGLPGVNVVVKGTTIGTVTDAEGKYTLSVPASGTALVFTFIGLKSEEVEIGERTTVDISLALDVTQLSEVVVTALNISTDVKKLPYSAQSVSASQLNMTRANNVNDALAGKVSGVQLRGQSGAALGRNSSIRIRGAGSLTDKEPLYIVDGTPVTNSADFNPDDIENITVLKGPSATALYGQRGDAGVVLVTTKKGTKGKGAGITINQNLFFDKVYILPQYQNSYAGGSYTDLQKFTYQDGMPAEWESLDGKYYHDYTDDASWGPRMVGQEYIPWYAWLPGTKYTGKTARLTPQGDNVRDFYETGVNSTTNISFSKASDAAAVRLSYTHQGQSGIMPNTDLDKNTLALSTSVDLSKIFTVGANINYVGTVINGEFDDAYSNQSTGSFNQWFHRDVEMDKLRELAFAKSPEGRYTSWNHFNPDYYTSIDPATNAIKGDKFYRGYYWYNPFTYYGSIDYKTKRNRLFGDINLTVNILDNLKAAVFYRKNQNIVTYENKRPSILPYSFYTENRPTTQPQWDFYGTGQSFYKEDNLEGMITYNEKFLDDKLTLDLLAGGNIRMYEESSVNMNTNLGLSVPDLYTISNSKETFQYSNLRYEKVVRSLYGQGTLGYNNTFFLNFSLRNDWSSALPADANSYLYPMVGASFVFSELTESVLPFLSYGKVRASFAQVGSDLDPYQTALTYSLASNPWGSNPISSTPDKQVDPNIKPSLSSSTEYGLDLKFFENRVGISATYFTETKKDEILEVGITGSSGFSTRLINAGELERKGFELQIDGTPILTDDFRWDATLNYANIKSTIVELVPGVTAIPAGTGGATFGMATTYHVEGKEWGQLRGQKILRNEDGIPILNANGTYKATTAPEDYGSVLPDFTGGFLNNLSYKNFLLSFNIDFQKGGQFYSLSDMWGSFSGLTKRTGGANDLGNPLRDPVADGGGVHVTGVDADGNPMDVYVEGQAYYHQFYFANIAEPHIYDLTYVKLRELSLGYQIPVQKLGSIGKVFTGASLSLVGRNLWLIYSDTKDFDPSEISGAFGENGQLPSARSMGFNLKLSF